MSETNLRPTPWKAVVVSKGVVDVFDAQGFDIATLYGTKALDTAKMMAAAPDMYEALQLSRELWKLAEDLCSCRGDDDFVWSALEKVDAALFRARGEAQ